MPDLGNKAWPSFDQSHGDSRTRIIENLGHADFLANQPFQHLNLSPVQISSGLSTGPGCIIPVRSTVSQPAARISFLVCFA
jgi:hypothetical protein